MFLLLACLWSLQQWPVISNKIIKFIFKFPKRIQVYFANAKELKLSHILSEIPWTVISYQFFSWYQKPYRNKILIVILLCLLLAQGNYKQLSQTWKASHRLFFRREVRLSPALHLFIRNRFTSTFHCTFFSWLNHNLQTPSVPGCSTTALSHGLPQLESRSPIPLTVPAYFFSTAKLWWEAPFATLKTGRFIRTHLIL